MASTVLSLNKLDLGQEYQLVDSIAEVDDQTNLLYILRY